ncbi:9787_t:CDS:2, partial [Dentiscutata erythropus]
TARLYYVLRAFGGILKMWQEYSDNDLAQSFLLNPNIHMSWFNANSENLNFTYLAQFITYYYKAWFECRPQFGEDILKFWDFASSSTRELGPLALHLFGICVNAASVERLWSSMVIHSAIPQ